MKTAAAILVELGRPLEIVELEVPKLASGQVLVEIRYSGVCHTQVLEARGHRGPDPFLPHCMGHEASGAVIDIGPGVTRVKPGDDVVLTWIKGEGAEVRGSRYVWNGRDVNAGAVTTFSRHSVVSENRLQPLPAAIDRSLAVLLGCAVPTGCGAVLNSAGARAGDGLAVIGCGGVGLCALAAAVHLGCDPIVAIDINLRKLEAARDLGAKHVIDAASQTVAEAIKAIAPDGLDIVIEASGQVGVMGECLNYVRPRGGRCVVIGNAPRGQRISLDPLQFNLGKQLLGTWGGDTVPERDFHRFAGLVAAQRRSFSAIQSAPYALERINDALDDLEGGAVLRPLIDMAL